MLRHLVVSNRSYRRFHQSVPIERSTLVALVDLARYWRDAEQIHHVPKRPLDEIILR